MESFNIEYLTEYFTEYLTECIWMKKTRGSPLKVKKIVIFFSQILAKQLYFLYRFYFHLKFEA